MKKLYWYLAKKFMVAIFFGLALASVVTIVFDIAEKMDDFLDAKVPLGSILYYYANFIPTIINVTSPIIIFISALYFTSRLANNSEIIAILSSGTSYYKILRPYIAVGILLMVLDMGMKNYIVPNAYSKALAFEKMYLETQYHYDVRNVHRQVDQNTFFYAQSIDYPSSRAYRFTIEKFDGQKLVYKLRSQEAYYDTIRKNWLANAYVLRTIDGLNEKVETGDSLRVNIPLAIQDFGAKIKSVPSMSTPELSRFIREQKFKGDDKVSFYLVEKYMRFSMPFSILVLVIIAVSIATRKVRGGLGTHLLLGVLTAISYVLFDRFSTTFATNADFPPILAVWVPNILFSGLAVYLLKKTPK